MPADAAARRRCRTRRSGSRISSRATSASARAATRRTTTIATRAYVLNTMLGGSMSSRLFQNVRERRGLAYAVFSSLSAYRDAGSLTIYAGCADDAVRELVDVVVDELRGMKVAPPDAELRRAKDHLKGSLMLSLESTSSRMSNLARQEIYFDRQFGLDETIEGIERVSTEDVVRVARDLFSNGSLGATVLGQQDGLELSRAQLDLGASRMDFGLDGLPTSLWPLGTFHFALRTEMISRYTNPEMGRIWTEERRYRGVARGRARGRRRHGRRRHRPARRRTRAPGARAVRHRPHRGNRADDASRCDRVHDGRGRARGPGSALSAFRPDVFGRRRHGAGAADGRGVRSRSSGTSMRWPRPSVRGPTSTGTRR